MTRADPPAGVLRARVLLAARWLRLVNVTYAVPPERLARHVPEGVELDVVDGRAFVGLVAFAFEGLRYRGLRIPFHGRFAEMNLRYYVRHGGERGVVFLRECAPRRAVVWAARWLHGEPYRWRPLREEVRRSPDGLQVRHTLDWGGRRHRVEAEAEERALLPLPGTLEDRFTQLTLAFGRGRDGGTRRYRARHPAWRTHPVRRAVVDLDFATVFDSEWGFLTGANPLHVTLVQGSAVEVLVEGAGTAHP